MTEIKLSEQVKQQMADNPELAEAMREIFANMHQAMHGVQSGQYQSFDDAMEAITGQRPKPAEEGEAEEALEQWAAAHPLEAAWCGFRESVVSSDDPDELKEIRMTFYVGINALMKLIASDTDPQILTREMTEFVGTLKE